MSQPTETVHIKMVVDSISFRKYTIKVIEGPDRGLTRTFDRRQIFIGTAPDNHLVLTDPTVSRTHAKIEYADEGYRITDQLSKNGITVQGVKIIGAYLTGECRITLGQTTVLFSLGTDQVELAIARESKFGGLLGQSVEMREIFAILKKVAPSEATVLVEGESGTGKELIAEALHQFGPRRNKPMVVFDCSAVPRELLESELFGHVRGAFTGAIRDRVGAMEEANGGTLFLDEVGELPLELQPKLLRALEKQEIKPVGSNRRVQLDVRIICATNRILEQEVENGNFRRDLFYRLGVIHIQLPPLRKRPEDIPLLADHFLAEMAEGKAPHRLSYDTMERLKSHSWPGNVRELRNFLERAVILSGDSDGSSSPLDLPGPTRLGSLKNNQDSDEILQMDFDAPFKDEKLRLTSTFEKRYFDRLLRRTEGNISKAARIAGIHRKTLEYMLKQQEPDL